MKISEQKEYEKLVNRTFNNQNMTKAQKDRLNELSKLRVEGIRKGTVPRLETKIEKKRRERAERKGKIKVSKSSRERALAYAEEQKEIRAKRRQEFLTKLGLNV
jgi:hypothetical protein